MAIASTLRVAAKNAKAVEPNLEQKLSIKINFIDKYFRIKMFDFTHVKTEKVSTASETVAYSTDLEALIEYIKEKRSLSNYHLKSRCKILQELHP